MLSQLPDDISAAVLQIVRHSQRTRTIVVSIIMVVIMLIAVASAWVNLRVSERVVSRQEETDEKINVTLDATADWAIQTYQVLNEFKKTIPKGKYLKIPAPPPLLQGGEWLGKDDLVNASPPPTAKIVRERRRSKVKQKEPFNLLKWMFTPRTTQPGKK